MAAQGERVSGAVEIDAMGSSVLDPMAQDKIPEQDIVMEELELPPQMDTEPEMGAAAAEAAVYDTSPSLLRNPPPIPAETAQPSALDVILQAINDMKNEMDGSARRMEKKMNAHTQTMPGEMQKMGHGLQVGIMAFASEVRTTADKVAPHVLRPTS